MTTVNNSNGAAILESALESRAKAYGALQSINQNGTETFASPVIKAAYRATANHLKMTNRYLHSAWAAGVDHEDVEIVDEVSNRCESLRAVCDLLTAVPEGDYDLAAIEWLIFNDLEVIEEGLCKLGGIEVPA